MMKYLQKLGKALMLPVACLPICGILMGIGYALCPATMQGGDITGAKALIGFFLVKAGGALIDNMAWLFVIVFLPVSSEQPVITSSRERSFRTGWHFSAANAVLPSYPVWYRLSCQLSCYSYGRLCSAH